MTPLLSRFLQNNIRASLDKLALRNRGVGQKKISGPLLMEQHKMEQTATLESLHVGFVNLEPESYHSNAEIYA